MDIKKTAKKFMALIEELEPYEELRPNLLAAIEADLLNQEFIDYFIKMLNEQLGFAQEVDDLELVAQIKDLLKDLKGETKRKSTKLKKAC